MMDELVNKPLVLDGPGIHSLLPLNDQKVTKSRKNWTKRNFFILRSFTEFSLSQKSRPFAPLRVTRRRIQADKLDLLQDRRNCVTYENIIEI